MGTCERVRVLSVAVGGFDDGVGQSLSCWRNDILVADGELHRPDQPGLFALADMGDGHRHLTSTLTVFGQRPVEAKVGVARLVRLVLPPPPVL
jgi:hypothetical protein